MFDTEHLIVETILADNYQLVNSSLAAHDPLAPCIWKVEVDPQCIIDDQFPTTYLEQACFLSKEVNEICEKKAEQQALRDSQGSDSTVHSGQIKGESIHQSDGHSQAIQAREKQGSSTTLKQQQIVTTEWSNIIVNRRVAFVSHNFQEINGHQQQLKSNHSQTTYEKFFTILKKRTYRLDQIFKVTIRYLSKRARERFQAYMKENDITQTHPSQIKDELLKHFIELNFNLTLRANEIDTAKSFFFCFSLKTKEPVGINAKEKVARLRNSFVEKGTLKEALLFFTSQVGLHCFFIDFVYHILEAVKYTGYEGRRMYLRGLRKLIGRIRGKKNSDRVILNQADEIIDAFGY